MTRGLALLGMIAVHALLPYDENFEPNWVTFGPTGHASAIFAVLAGVGLSLTTGRARVPWGNAGPAAAALLGRAAAIGVVGLALGYADAGVTGVILVYYAVLFVLAIPVVLLPTRWVVVVGVCAAVAVPVLSQVVRPGLGEVEAAESEFRGVVLRSGWVVVGVVVDGFVSGFAVDGVCVCGVGGRPVAVVDRAGGLVLGGRRTHARGRWQGDVVVAARAARGARGAGGSDTAEFDPDSSVDDLLTFGFDGTTPTDTRWWLATDAPHAGTPPDLIGTTGVALAILGAMLLLLGHVGNERVRRIIRFATAPLAAAGAMSLTLYAAHVVFMNSPLDVFGATEGYVLQVVVGLMVALGWRQAVGRGPLETGVTAAANGLKTLVSTRPAERPATAAAEQLGRHRIPSLQPAIENRSAVAGGVSGRSGAAGRDRLVGLDVTRGLALLGMIAVHALLPYDENFEPNWVTFGPTGHASAIFAVLAGVGLSLTTGRARVPWGNAGPAAAALLGRAAAIGVVGLALGYADAGVTGVILVYYAVLFVLAIPVVLLPTRWVVVVGVCAAVAVPVLSQVVRPGLGEVEGRNPSFGALFSDPGGLLSELLWTGLYPALPWMAYVCAGLVVGRLRLSTARVAWSLVAVGLTLAALAAEAASVLLDDLGGRAALLLAGTGDDRSVDELSRSGSTASPRRPAGGGSPPTRRTRALPLT